MDLAFKMESGKAPVDYSKVFTKKSPPQKRKTTSRLSSSRIDDPETEASGEKRSPQTQVNAIYEAFKVKASEFDPLKLRVER